MMDGLDIAEEVESGGNCILYLFLFSCLFYTCTRLVNNDFSVYMIANQAFETDETIESDHSQNSEINSGKETLKIVTKPEPLTKFKIFFTC